MGAKRTTGWLHSALAVAAGGLLWASAAVHLDLYVTGYRRIPTIGTLFLLQAATGVALGIAVVATSRSARPRGSTAGLASLSGAAFALGTVIAYSLSRAVGLFGFHELPSTAGLAAGVLEVGAFLAFGALFVEARAGSPASTALSVAQASTVQERATSSKPKPARAFRALTVMTAAIGMALLATVLTLGLGSPASPTKPSGHQGGAPSAHLAVLHVRISGFGFHPARIRARPGEVIAVTNDDQVTHTMTAVPGAVPDGRFNTGYVAPGRTVRIRAPRQPGGYAFYCSIHPFMKGVLSVAP
jgi:plastocyanin